MELRTTRRQLLATPALTLLACGRKRAPRYSGWLFIASASEHGIAVADLAEFRRVTTIALPQSPRQILRAGPRVFATCPDARTICEIDPRRFTVAGRISLPGRIVSCFETPRGDALVAVTDQPSALHLIEPSTRRIIRTALFSGTAVSADVSDEIAAINLENHSLMRVSLASGKILGMTPLGLKGGIIRFRPDGRTILTGAADQSQIVSVDAATGQILARLPVAFVPSHFCFSLDQGGQMFVTGSGEDSIVIVSPYQNEVALTMVAGQKPHGLAVATVNSRNLLFVTDSGSADLTIFDIDTRGLTSSVHIGGRPGEVLITPDGAYALVIDRDSGDVSVVRMTVALDRNVGRKEREASLGQGTRPLFTVFPTGASPQSAAIIPL